MTDTLTILCPVTSRGCEAEAAAGQPLFCALLPSMDALAMWGSVRLLIGADEGDAVWEQMDPITTYDFEGKQIDICWLEGMTGNITAIWNELGRRAEPFEWLLPANDDLAFETSPLPAMGALKARSGFGIIGFHDHAFPGLATFFVVGRIHFEIFGDLYPLPWTGAHQDSWIADVYRPWGASEIDPSIRCHNRIGIAKPRFEYGAAENYRQLVLIGRRKVNDWCKAHPHVAAPLADERLRVARTIL